MLKTALFSFLLPILASAQYGPAPGPSTPTTSAAAAVAVPSAPPSTAMQINIDVAVNETFFFSPANVSAPVGANVSFFFPANGLSHSVTQSSFGAPCTYLVANTTANTTAGFDSGLIQGEVFTVTILDTQPIWFHCKQVTHCGMGMVGSINAAEGTANSFENFMAAALAIGTGEVTETDNGAVIAGVHASAVGTPAATVSAASTGSTTSGSSQIAASTALALIAAVVAFVMA